MFFCFVFFVVHKHQQLAPIRGHLILATSSASVCDVCVTLGSIMSGRCLRQTKCWFTFKRSDYFKGSLIIFKVNLFVFRELTKITVKEPNDLFSGVQTTPTFKCDVSLWLLWKCSPPTSDLNVLCSRWCCAWRSPRGRLKSRKLFLASLLHGDVFFIFIFKMSCFRTINFY